MVLEKDIPSGTRAVNVYATNENVIRQMIANVLKAHPPTRLVLREAVRCGERLEGFRDVDAMPGDV